MGQSLQEKSDNNIDSSSYGVFKKCIKRAENLIHVNESTKSNDSVNIEETHYCDCYRACIVLSISALDAFIRKMLINQIIYKLSSKAPLNNQLSEYIKSLLNQDELFKAARELDLSERVEKAVKEDFEKKSFQGDWKISKYMNYLGFKNIFSEVSKKKDINEGNLRKDLKMYTDRRHVIAHSGDYNLNQTPIIENSIDREFAENCIKAVSNFAKAINEIIEEDGK